jgi:hypothetical protein
MAWWLMRGRDPEVAADAAALQLVRKATSQCERHQRAVVLRLGSWRELHQDPAALQLLEAIAAWLLDPARTGGSAAGGLPIDTLGESPLELPARLLYRHDQMLHCRPLALDHMLVAV